MQSLPFSAPGGATALTEARLLEQDGRPDEALRILSSSIVTGELCDSPTLHIIGRLHQKLGNYNQAKRAYLKALIIDPFRPQTLNNLILIELEFLDSQAAEHWLHLAIELPHLSDHESELLAASSCQLRLFQLRPLDALHFTRHQLRSTVSVMTLNNHAACLHKLGRFAPAVRAQECSLRHFLFGHPSARQSPWSSSVGISLGDPASSAMLQSLLFHLGIYRLCVDTSDVSAFPLIAAYPFSKAEFWADPSWIQTYWSGGACDRLIVWDDQGYGDAIQNLAWIHLAACRVKRLDVWLRPSLLPLVSARARLPPNCCLHAMDATAAPQRQGAVQVPLFCLPFVLDAWPAPSCRARQPYLSSSRSGPASDPARVGLVWSAGRHSAPQPERCARERDVPFDDLWAMALVWQSDFGCQLVSFQLDASDHPRAAKLIAAGQLLQPHLTPDWLSTLELLEDIDILVSVDTSVAHLAGAIGLPCVLLLPCPADWRWGQKPSSTPLYSGMYLARCVEPGNWTDALLKASSFVTRFLSGK